jgi:O-antigen/teichoic acid export membrane protein
MLKGARAMYANTGRGGIVLRAVVGSAWLRIVGSAMAFLVGAQLARALGPAGYGIYGIAMSWVAIAMIPTELGLPQLATREAAMADASGDRSRIVALLRWTCRFVFANTAGVLLLAFIAVFALRALGSPVRAVIAPPLAWGLAMLPVVAISNVASAVLRGMHRVVEGQLAELILRPALLSMALLAIWALLPAHTLTPVLVMVLNVAVAAVGMLWVLWRLRPRLHGVDAPPAESATRSRWLRSTIPLAMSEGMRILSGNVAVQVLALLASDADVGLYRVAAGVYTATSLPSGLLNAACSPMLASLHAEGRTEAIQRLNAWMALFLVVAAVCFMLPFVFVGGPILSLAFGRDYAASNPILVVLLVGELAAACLGHPTVVLNMLHHEQAVTRYSLTALVLNIVLSLALVPMFGAAGAAIGMMASQVAWRGLCAWYARTRLGLDTTLLAWRTA